MNGVVTLCGRDYSLTFSVNALCLLEEKTGLSLGKLQGQELSCIRGLIWCGQAEAQTALSLEETGDLLDRHLRSGGDISSVSRQLASALEDACFFPRRREEETKASPSAPDTDA